MKEKNSQNQKLENIVRIILIIGILILIPFIVFTFNRRDPPHIIISYLNKDLELGNYPSEVNVDENITLYFKVTSYWNEPLNIQVRHIIGKSSSIFLSSNGSINGTVMKYYNHTIQISEVWLSDEINTTFSESLYQNEHYLIIFELWVDVGSGWEFLHDQIVFNRLNVTYQL